LGAVLASMEYEPPRDIDFFEHPPPAISIASAVYEMKDEMERRFITGVL
jgi:hypothetical protein